MSAIDPTTVRNQHRYELLTWLEINEAVAQEKVVVLPVAAIEQHGHHLPIDVDVRSANTICQLAGAASPEDMLVLPPSFPIGGMENPRMTFLTPTMIAGDRSLNDLIAHELAHSWSGNLVTNASWKHWWLNEGFTTYVTTRIVEKLYGDEVAEMNLQVEQEEALASLANIPAAKQVLATRGADNDPSAYPDGSLIYPKGAWFLRTLVLKKPLRMA